MNPSRGQFACSGFSPPSSAQTTSSRPQSCISSASTSNDNSSSIIITSRLAAICESLIRFDQDVHDAFRPLFLAAEPVPPSTKKKSTNEGIFTSKQYAVLSAVSSGVDSTSNRRHNWLTDPESVVHGFDFEDLDPLGGTTFPTKQSLGHALDWVVSKLEQQFSSLLSRIQSSVRSFCGSTVVFQIYWFQVQVASSGIEALQLKWKETERKSVRQV